MLIAYTQKHVILPKKQIGDKVRHARARDRVFYVLTYVRA